MPTTTRIAVLLSSIALGAGVLAAPVAASAEPGRTSCAQQERQVDKAEDALARAVAAFQARQAEKAEKAEKSEADKSEKKVEKAEKATATKAQVQRLAKARARLSACTARQSTQG